MKKRILIIIIVLVLLAGGVTAYFVLNNKSDNTNKESNTAGKTKIIFSKNTKLEFDGGLVTMTFYEFAINEPTTMSGYEKVGEYVCKNKDCSVDHSYALTAWAVINDDDILLYNGNTKEKIYIKDLPNFPTDYVKITPGTIITSSKDEILLIGAIMSQDEYGRAKSIRYYNYKTSKVILESNQYLNYLSDSYVLHMKEVLDLDGNVQYETNYGKGYKIAYNKNLDVYYKGGTICYVVEDILDNNFKPLITDFDSYEAAFTSNNNITVNPGDNKYYIYDKNGNKISESKQYDKVYDVAFDLVAVLENNKLYIIDVVNNETSEIVTMTDNIEFYGFGHLNGYENEEYYLVTVIDNSIPEGETGHGVEYLYNTNTKEVTSEKKEDLYNFTCR